MIEPKIQEAILAEYDQQIHIYGDLANTAVTLLDRVLSGSDVQLHSITQRPKSRESLAKKLAKPDKEYAHLSDITDLAAVRIITFFEEDVDRVAESVEREFLIDRENSVDKRKLLDPDRFGYQSLHYVATFTKKRCSLVEYKKFKGRKLEIQVRSILQHAWAEIEHDMGYKSAAAIPREIRRRFSRIAGLLEIADDEFSTIRQELMDYQVTVSKEIKERPEEVLIDKISLKALVANSNSAISRLSRVLASIAKAKLVPISDSVSEDFVKALGLLSVFSISDLEQLATSRKRVVERFARDWLTAGKYTHLHAGVAIFYLAYVLLGERADRALIREYIRQVNIRDSDGTLESRILETYQKAYA